MKFTQRFEIASLIPFGNDVIYSGASVRVTNTI